MGNFINLKQIFMRSLKQNVIAVVVVMGLVGVLLIAFTLVSYYGSPARAEELYQEAVELKDKTEAEALNMIAEAEKMRCQSEVDLATKKVKAFYDGKRPLEDGEDLQKLVSKTMQNCAESGETMQDHPQGVEVQAMNLIEGKLLPSNLFYTFRKSDNTVVSQSPKEHFKNNGYMATDVSTKGRKLDIFAPSLVKDGQDQSRTYTVQLSDNIGTMGQTIELHWLEDGTPYAWWIGHVNNRKVKTGDVVTTGDLIGESGGCKGELKLDEKSTGCHVHIELRIDGQAVDYPLNSSTRHVRHEVGK